MLVADARESILAPVIGAGSGLIMSEVVPSVSIVAVAPRGPYPTASRSDTGPTFCREPFPCELLRA